MKLGEGRQGGGQSFCSHVGQRYHIAAGEPAGESTPAHVRGKRGTAKSEGATCLFCSRYGSNPRSLLPVC